MYKSSRPKVAALWFPHFSATVEVAQEVKTLCSQSGGREFESLRISSADPSFMAAPYCNNSTVYSMASDRCYFWKYIYRVFISIQYFMLRCYSWYLWNTIDVSRLNCLMIKVNNWNFYFKTTSIWSLEYWQFFIASFMKITLLLILKAKYTVPVYIWFSFLS